jgi:zinc-ribbon domain
MAEEDSPLVIAPTPAVCSSCGTRLPDGSQFCLQCGQFVSPDPNVLIVDAERISPPAKPRKTGSKRRIVAGAFLLAFAAAASWLAMSDAGPAQQLREDIIGYREQNIADTPLLVNPRGYSYYKFTVPPGAVKVLISGQFDATGASENTVEASLLTDSALVLWRNGYSTGKYYESGRVTQGTINTELPSGAGVYYLLFDNRFSPKASKTIHATVLLRYKRWLPEPILAVKDKLWDWLGLS